MPHKAACMLTGRPPAWGVAVRHSLLVLSSWPLRGSNSGAAAQSAVQEKGTEGIAEGSRFLQLFKA